MSDNGKPPECRVCIHAAVGKNGDDVTLFEVLLFDDEAGQHGYGKALTIEEATEQARAEYYGQ